MKYIWLFIISLAFASCDNVGSNGPNAGELIPNPEAANKDTFNNPSQKAFADVNMRMHSGMNTIDADPDIAFIQGMIVHHQGAVEMANIILEYGDDEEAKDLARNIIKAQEEEIAWMKKWLSEKGLQPIPVEDHDHEGH